MEVIPDAFKDMVYWQLKWFLAEVEDYIHIYIVEFSNLIYKKTQ